MITVCYSSFGREVTPFSQQNRIASCDITFIYKKSLFRKISKPSTWVTTSAFAFHSVIYHFFIFSILRCCQVNDIVVCVLEIVIVTYPFCNIMFFSIVTIQNSLQKWEKNWNSHSRFPHLSLSWGPFHISLSLWSSNIRHYFKTYRVSWITRWNF